ncbi:MAG TPA: hypothetical protein VG122_21665 [Gemmata sp.]|nr:hypothetical protein [Gemmata sp.]
MFRMISLLGVGVVCLIVALIVVLFDFRIALDESWNVQKVLFVSFLAIAVLSFVGVYVGRRREVRQRKAIAAEDNRLHTPR